MADDRAPVEVDGTCMESAVLAPLIAEALHDPETLGILMHGSRGAGMPDEKSDYDLLWVLTDGGYGQRDAEGRCGHQVTMRDGRKEVEIDYSSPKRLTQSPEWYIRGLATAQIVVDKGGEMGRLLTGFRTVPEERMQADLPDLFDGYLNGFYRSVKAGRRGNELGARLQAAESLMYLVRALFLMERRQTPFHDRLIVSLDALSGQGWGVGELEDLFLGILRTAHLDLQIRLEERVERLMRERGYGAVIDSWDGEIERVKQ